jgi:hypothetical protein
MKPQTAEQINGPQVGIYVPVNPVKPANESKTAESAKRPLQHGTKVVFGIPKAILPIVGLPEGKVRLRFRANGVGRVFVKTANSIRGFVLKDCGDHWEAAFEQGMNLRIANRNQL